MPLSPQEILYERMWSTLSSRPVGEKESTLLKGYLRAGKDDLRASRILYRNGLSALATYHLQQAVEKGTKAFCLLSGQISAEEVRAIRHDSLRGHQIFANKLSRFVKMLAQSDPKFNVPISKLDEIRKNQLEVAKMGSGDIDKILAAFEAVDNSFDAIMPQLSQWVLTKLSEAIRDKSGGYGTKSDINKLTKKVKQGISLARSVPFLYVASALTFPHWESTRYPDKEIKPWHYDMSMGIVARMPSLIEGVEKALESLSRFSD